MKEPRSIWQSQYGANTPLDSTTTLQWWRAQKLPAALPFRHADKNARHVGKIRPGGRSSHFVPCLDGFTHNSHQKAIKRLIREMFTKC